MCEDSPRRLRWVAKAALLPRDESVIINLWPRHKDMPMVEKLMKVLKAVDAVDSLAEFLAGEGPGSE